MSRRRFLAAVAGAGISANAAPAPGRELLSQPAISSNTPPPGAPLGREVALRIRPSILSLTAPQLEALRRGVAAMKALDPSDRRSWAFQAAIHGTSDPAARDPLFNRCAHGTPQFLPWHRGYLHFFERILRWAAKDPDLMLPFWDWTSRPVLPDPFRYPADASNPLYELKRKGNDGSALLASVVADDLDTALRQTAFAAAEPGGFSSRLEESPHGQVHTGVGGTGGLMSSVPTAARDPIFWLHHANVDRLWDVWLNQGGGRGNPAASTYLDTAYTFADETGGTVTVRVRDILRSGDLGYRYEGVPNPRAGALVAQAGPSTAPVAATSAAPEKFDASLEKVGATPLGFEEKRVRLNVVKKGRASLARPVAPGGSGTPKILVAIEGLSADVAPDFTYRVYVNLPAGERSEAVLRRHYVGSINFFGKTRSDRRALGHEHGAGNEFTATFDATPVVARLQQRGRFDPDALSVTILPAASSPPGTPPEQVRMHAAAVAKEAKVSYKRISVRVSGGE